MRAVELPGWKTKLSWVAAVLLAVALGAFATSSVVFLKEIGIGAVVAVTAPPVRELGSSPCPVLGS